MKTGFGNVKFACNQPLIQFFHIQQLEIKFDITGIDFIVQQSMKRERVIGTSRDTDLDFVRHGHKCGEEVIEQPQFQSATEAFARDD